MVTGTILVGKLETTQSQLLVVFTYEDGDSAEYKRVEKLLGEQLAELKKSKEFEGKALTFALLRTPSLPFKKLLLVGLGKKKDVTLETLRRAAGTAVKAAREKADAVTIPFSKDTKAKGLAEAVQAVAEGIILGDYRFLKYKTQELEMLKQLKGFTILVEEKGQLRKAKDGLDRAKTLAASVILTRDLVNTPAAEMNPAHLEAEARKLAKKHGFKLTVFDAKELAKRKMQGILSVGKGSDVPPRMIILEYEGPGAKKHIVLCGKGVCFDSGGYNIKTQMMEQMKDDMAAAATLLGALDAIATLKVKVHVTVIIGAVENLINGGAYKPGDIITAMNGKTIEVANTDAEGRIVLADCLAYASTLRPNIIIDLATLTGAARVVAGNLAAIIMTPNDKLAKQLAYAGEATGDRTWRLPLWDDYAEDVKSDIADVKNVGYPYTAGTIIGGIFLKNFVEKPESWAHIDIAGVAFDDRERPYIPKGATGWGVRLLTRFVENN